VKLGFPPPPPRVAGNRAKLAGFFPPEEIVGPCFLLSGLFFPQKDFPTTAGRIHILTWRGRTGLPRRSCEALLFYVIECTSVSFPFLLRVDRHKRLLGDVAFSVLAGFMRRLIFLSFAEWGLLLVGVFVWPSFVVYLSFSFRD